MKTIKHYTPEEDAIIIKCIKENPGNFRKAFKIASGLLPERSVAGVNFHWYNKLQYKVEATSLKGGDTAILINRKNVRDVEEPTLRMQVVRVAIQGMSVAERLQAIQLLMS